MMNIIKLLEYPKGWETCCVTTAYLLLDKLAIDSKMMNNSIDIKNQEIDKDDNIKFDPYQVIFNCNLIEKQMNTIRKSELTLVGLDGEKGVHMFLIVKIKNDYYVIQSYINCYKVRIDKYNKINKIIKLIRQIICGSDSAFEKLCHVKEGIVTYQIITEFYDLKECWK